MKQRSLALLTASLITLFAQTSLADPAITGVTAQQRYPWNGKVDITYTVSGDIAAAANAQAAIPSLKVTATDRDTGTSYTATSLSGDTSLANGTHSIVWDMDAQGLTFVSTNVIFSVSCETTPATYCVIDLSAGANASSYPVTYLAESPSGGFNVDAYKTTKLVMKRIEAGSFQMGGSANVTLTKPFFLGLFEVTQKQYSLVTGSNPSNFSGDKRPVEKVSYNMIRGSSNGAQWPASNAVDADSFLGKLRARSGLDFDLPTEAQWEYACRAGTMTTYSYGNTANGDYMWYSDNSSSQTHEVGTKSPNPWGLYDMHGNVWEWCVDWYGTLAYGTDPSGSSSGSRRVLRGGGVCGRGVLQSGCDGGSDFHRVENGSGAFVPLGRGGHPLYAGWLHSRCRVERVFRIVLRDEQLHSEGLRDLSRLLRFGSCFLRHREGLGHRRHDGRSRPILHHGRRPAVRSRG